MSTWRPPWSAQEQVKLTLLPPTRANNSPRPGDLPGRDRRPRWARARGGAPAPRDLPADLGWLSGCRPGLAADHVQARWPSLRATPSEPSQPYRPAPQTRRTRQAATDPTRPQRPRPARYGEAERVCPAWVGEQSKHGGADAQWQTPRRRRRTDGARLRRNPNLCRGRLHRLALPVQPRSTLRDPPRLGPAGDDPHEATPPLSCRGRWSAQHGGRFNVVSHAVSARHLHHSALSVSAFSVVLLARSTT
jgi:hypothetical protein